MASDVRQHAAPTADRRADVARLQLRLRQAKRRLAEAEDGSPADAEAARAALVAQLGPMLDQRRLSMDAELETARAAAERRRDEAGREAIQIVERAEQSIRERALREEAEQTLRRQAVIEKAARDQLAREAAEQAARDEAERTARETAAREAAAQALREQQAREAAEREAAEQALREQQAREIAAREAAEQAWREQQAREAAELAAREAAEVAAREAAMREAVKQAAREQAAREAAEQAAREQQAREQQAREQAAHEAAEQAWREQQTRDAADREARDAAERVLSEQAERQRASLALQERAERARQRMAGTAAAAGVPNVAPMMDPRLLPIVQIVDGPVERSVIPVTPGNAQLMGLVPVATPNTSTGVAPNAVPAAGMNDPEVFARAVATVLTAVMGERGVAAPPQVVVQAPSPQKGGFWANARHLDVMLLGLTTVIVLVVLAAWLA